jgi:hypothetical protein
LPVAPADTSYDSQLVAPFNYTMPEEFLIGGDPKLVQIDAWFDKMSIKSIQFTFSNGKSNLQTEIFGQNKTTVLSKYTA